MILTCNFPKLSNLKQQTFITSQTLWVRNQNMTEAVVLSEGSTGGGSAFKLTLTDLCSSLTVGQSCPVVSSIWISPQSCLNGWQSVSPTASHLKEEHMPMKEATIFSTTWSWRWRPTISAMCHLLEGVTKGSPLLRKITHEHEGHWEETGGGHFWSSLAQGRKDHGQWPLLPSTEQAHQKRGPPLFSLHCPQPGLGPGFSYPGSTHSYATWGESLQLPLFWVRSTLVFWRRSWMGQLRLDSGPPQKR